MSVEDGRFLELRRKTGRRSRMVHDGKRRFSVECVYPMESLFFFFLFFTGKMLKLYVPVSFTAHPFFSSLDHLRL